MLKTKIVVPRSILEYLKSQLLLTVHTVHFAAQLIAAESHSVHLNLGILSSCCSCATVRILLLLSYSHQLTLMHTTGMNALLCQL